MGLKKKLKTWACSEGCQISKAPCKHLEKLLNRGVARSDGPGPVLVKGLEMQTYQDDAESFELKCRELENKLDDLGIDPNSAMIFVDHIIGELPISQLVKDYGTNKYTIELIIKNVSEIVSKHRTLFGENNVND